MTPLFTKLAYLYLHKEQLSQKLFGSKPNTGSHLASQYAAASLPMGMGNDALSNRALSHQILILNLRPLRIYFPHRP